MNIAQSDNREQRIVRTSILGIVANVALAAFKAAVGLLANSIAIVLDAVNNATDALSSVVTIIGTRLANRKPDYKHPFGHGRTEYLTAIVIGVIVAYAGITSLVESIKRIISPEAADYSTIGLLIIVVAVVVKLVLGSYVKRVGREVNSDSLEASGTDALLDAVISASTVVAALVYMATGLSLEAPLGAIISLVIIKAAYDILAETISKIIGRRADAELSQGIKKTISEVDGVRGVYDLVLTDFGPEQFMGSVHVEVDETATANDIDAMTRQIQRKVMQEHGISMAAVGIYTTNSNDEVALAMRKTINDIAFSHDHVKEVHGFYVNHASKTIQFDIVLTFDADDREELYRHIAQDVQTAYPDYSVQVILDSDITD
ncbi:MAG: cation transporter [Eggerthellaceae bacterium]|nr:cation transporter [Eggerthellaceae bacterium]